MLIRLKVVPQIMLGIAVIVLVLVPVPLPVRRHLLERGQKNHVIAQLLWAVVHMGKETVLVHRIHGLNVGITVIYVHMRQQVHHGQQPALAISKQIVVTVRRAVAREQMCVIRTGKNVQGVITTTPHPLVT